MNQKLIALRQELHRYPEVSNNEYATSIRIVDFIEVYQPDEILKLGETGLAFVFKGEREGKTVVFRAELDALPIQEKSELAYASRHANVGHLCGHDGHMAIIAGLAQRISESRPRHGKVVLLFQPAEEVEQGAVDVLKHEKFKSLEPDYLFALHNVPGIDKHKIILKTGSFAAASKGLTVKLTGKTSHAAEPQDGISPADAIAAIIPQIHALRDNKTLFKDFILLTIIHIQLGELSFGTAPGYAELSITLRTFENEDMLLLTSKVENLIAEIAQKEKLEYQFSYTEVFPATVNTEECVQMVAQAANRLNLEKHQIDKPFKWSEDFAYFAEKYSTCYFGIGAGKEHPQLHNPDYDFPDDILDTGVDLFYAIYERFQCND
jgi:amidohydrolase